jgi:hypothetical protein
MPWNGFHWLPQARLSDLIGEDIRERFNEGVDEMSVHL